MVWVLHHPTSPANLRLVKTMFSCFPPKAGFVGTRSWFHWLRESSKAVSLEIMDDRLTISQQRALAAKRPMGSWGALRGVRPAGRGRFSFPSTLP